MKPSQSTPLRRVKRRRLNEIVSRAKAVMAMARQPGAAFGPFPANEALDFAWAVAKLSEREPNPKLNPGAWANEYD